MRPMTTSWEQPFSESAVAPWGHHESQRLEVHSFSTALLVVSFGAMMIITSGYYLLAQLYRPQPDFELFGPFSVILLSTGLWLAYKPFFEALELDIDSGRVIAHYLIGRREVSLREFKDLRTRRKWTLECSELIGNGRTIHIKASGRDPSPVHMMLQRWASQAPNHPNPSLPIEIGRNPAEFLARSLLISAIVAGATYGISKTLGLPDAGQMTVYFTILSVISTLTMLIYLFILSPYSVSFAEKEIVKRTLLNSTHYSPEKTENLEWKVDGFSELLILKNENGELRVPGTMSNIPLGILASVLSSSYLNSDGVVSPWVYRSDAD